MLNDYIFEVNEAKTVDLTEIRREAAKLQAEELKRLSALVLEKVSNLFSFGATRHA